MASREHVLLEGLRKLYHEGISGGRGLAEPEAFTQQDFKVAAARCEWERDLKEYLHTLLVEADSL